MVSAMLLIQVTWFRNRDHPRPDLVTWFYWSHSGLLLQVTIDLMFLSTSVPYTKCPGHSCVPVHCSWIWSQTGVLAFQDETETTGDMLYQTTNTLLSYKASYQSTLHLNPVSLTICPPSSINKACELVLPHIRPRISAQERTCTASDNNCGIAPVSTPGTVLAAANKNWLQPWADNFPMNNSDSVRTTSILPSYT